MLVVRFLLLLSFKSMLHVCNIECIPGQDDILIEGRGYKKSQGLWNTKNEEDPDEDSLGEFDEDVPTTKNIEEPTNIDANTGMAPPPRDPAGENQVTWAGGRRLTTTLWTRAVVGKGRLARTTIIKTPTDIGFSMVVFKCPSPYWGIQ